MGHGEGRRHPISMGSMMTMTTMISLIQWMPARHLVSIPMTST